MSLAALGASKVGERALGSGAGDEHPLRVAVVRLTAGIFVLYRAPNMEAVYSQSALLLLAGRFYHNSNRIDNARNAPSER